LKKFLSESTSLKDENAKRNLKNIPGAPRIMNFYSSKKCHEENRRQATNSKDISAAHLPTKIINVQDI